MWSSPHNHYYFPLTIRDNSSKRRLVSLFDPESLPLCTVTETKEQIQHISVLTGIARADKETEYGISDDSILFKLPNIVEYENMHLFYNIGKDMVELWLKSNNQDYSLPAHAVKIIDRELSRSGNGIPR